MRHQLTGRDIVTLTFVVYEKFSHIADQYPSRADFPEQALDTWRKNRVVSKDVIPAMFVYFNRNGHKIEYNEFIFSRIQTAINKGGETIEDITDIAINSPILKPNEYAIQATEENIGFYLEAMGGDELFDHYEEILRLVILYHQHELYAFVRDEAKKRAAGYPTPKQEVNTWQGLSSEMYHRMPGNFDWDAIASFIIDDTEGQGNGMKLQQQLGAQGMVYKRPLPTACRVCKKLYQNPDGIPKLFSIDSIVINGPLTIQDRIEENSKPKHPTCGPSHLHCYCKLYAYTGYEPWAEKH